MSPSTIPSLAELTAKEREQAMARYQLIAPLLAQEKPSQADWQAAAEQAERSLKTIKRWVKRYQTSGLAGLARQRRSDKGVHRSVSVQMQRTIEALYLENRYRSMETVHTVATAYARKHDEPLPSYTVVREICQALPPSVVYMAHYGEHAWRNKFEPISRHESYAPNERWQMDHCQLDLLVIDPQSSDVLGRSWLTLALDTYSRAVMGYHLGLDTPNSSVRAAVSAYHLWLEQERQHQLPLALTEEEVDAAILLERLKKSNLPPGPALFPSDRPGKFLTSGQEEEDYD